MNNLVKPHQPVAPAEWLIHTRNDFSHTLDICRNEKKAEKSLFPLGESHMEGSVQFVLNAFIGVIKTKLWTESLIL
jgi:hypothetical protein